jgi:hypothetical protein
MTKTEVIWIPVEERLPERIGMWQGLFLLFLLRLLPRRRLRQLGPVSDSQSFTLSIGNLRPEALGFGEFPFMGQPLSVSPKSMTS